MLAFGIFCETLPGLEKEFTFSLPHQQALFDALSD